MTTLTLRGLTDAATLVQRDYVLRDYDMLGCMAIVDHVKYGRLYAEDGFGGLDSLCGGCVAWRFGRIHVIHADDTLATLAGNSGDRDGNSVHARMVTEHDDTRPALEWPAVAITRLGEWIESQESPEPLMATT